jgi:hypothetical protein
MPRDYNNDIMRQATKPDEKIRMFHGTPNKIENGVIEARKVPYEDMGMEDSADEDPGGGMHLAFATSDIHEAARYAGPEGHIYEVHEKPSDMNTDWGYDHGDLAHSDGGELRIKGEVGHPGRNIFRRQHFDDSFGSSRQ